MSEDGMDRTMRMHNSPRLGPIELIRAGWGRFIGTGVDRDE